jgi:hypothetical protein
MINKVFDCHVHIDNGLNDYNIALGNANIIFNDIKQYKIEKNNFSSYYKSLIFDFKNNYDYVADEILSNQVHAVKIHSRIQQIREVDYPELLIVLKKINKSIPIIYDAFYYGNDLEFQPSLNGLIYLAKGLPCTKFVVAHAGGYKILDYFFHLKGLQNVAFDLSFSLQYLLDSSAELDLIKLIKHTQKEKLFFGSDFPYADPKLQSDKLIEILMKMNISNNKIEDIFTLNWLNFTSS